MKINALILGFLLGNLIFFSSCKSKPKDDVTPDNTETKLLITVKDSDQSIVSGVVVHLYESNENNDPSQSTTSTTSDQDGVAQFDLTDLIDDEEQATFYIKVIETSLALEHTLLGNLTINVPAEKPETIEDDLVIETRSLVYPNGFIPSVIDSRLARSEYDRWKSSQVFVCGDGLRVKADPANETRVEAIGFGTILSAYMSDKETFDGLMKFYESKRTQQANQMMAWLVTCEEIQDPGSATDGDIDVAFANIVASTKWGATYLDKAKEIINLIDQNLILDCQVDGATVKVLAPGYSGGLWGGCGLTDIQYYTPGFFRLFAQVTGNEVWNTLADDTYILLNASANETTGLVPDWQTASGSPGPSGRVGHYGYDACRVPWRITLDYLWNGNTEAAQWSSKIGTWAAGIGPSNIVDGYELDGTPIGTNGLNSSFLGGLSVATMTTNQSQVNNFSETLSGLNDSYWFNLNTRVLYLFTLTGNFQKPEL
jgi:endo-1,4-beta-D-glucanase Y